MVKHLSCGCKHGLPLFDPQNPPEEIHVDRMCNECWWKSRTPEQLKEVFQDLKELGVDLGVDNANL